MHNLQHDFIIIYLWVSYQLINSLNHLFLSVLPITNFQVPSIIVWQTSVVATSHPTDTHTHTHSAPDWSNFNLMVFSQCGSFILLSVYVRNSHLQSRDGERTWLKPYVDSKNALFSSGDERKEQGSFFSNTLEKRKKKINLNIRI